MGLKNGVTIYLCQAEYHVCRIADPESVKPEDWDEDAPKEIDDEAAEKPEGWLDDEPAEVPDPGKLLIQS